MAYLFLGIFLLLEGFAFLGAEIAHKKIWQGICLCLAGAIFILQSLNIF